MTKESEKYLNIQIISDKNCVPSDMSGERIVELTLTPSEPVKTHQRAPLNISLVIDRSGSMNGEKLHFVRKAAEHVLDLMTEHDQANVVIYDDTIEVLVPSTYLTKENCADAKTRVKSIRSGGSTNLFGGWMKGCELVAESMTDQTFNRTFLLTDGLANIGITNHEELGQHAVNLFQRGISTSTFGVGLGYDEHLLEMMANYGGGNFHFLETLQAIPLVFEREFLELLSISLRDVEISFDLPKGVKATVLAQWQSEMDGNTFRIQPGALYAGKSQRYYLRFKFAEGLTGNKVSIPIQVNGKNESGKAVSFKEVLTLNIVPSEQEKSEPIDTTMMERYALVEIAEKANEALKQERRGNRQYASTMINETVSSLGAFLSEESSAKYRTMSQNMAHGLDEIDRKRLHSQEYFNRRQRGIVHSYAIHWVDGVLTAQIEDKQVLIDTGSQISLGDEPIFQLNDRTFKLYKDFMGVNMQSISKALGSHIDVLMGTDILKNFCLTIDHQHGIVTFTDDPILTPRYRIPFNSFLGTPVVSGQVQGIPVNLLLDTGTKLSYLDRKLIEGLPQIDTTQDFYPTFGTFETPVYEVTLQLSYRIELTLKVGVLPTLIEQAVHMAHANGILGNELYPRFLACLAFPLNTILLE